MDKNRFGHASITYLHLTYLNAWHRYDMLHIFLAAAGKKPSRPRKPKLTLVTLQFQNADKKRKMLSMITT